MSMVTTGPAPTASLAQGASAVQARSSDLMLALASIEARHPVHEWLVEGLPVWPLVRLRWVFAEWARQYASTGQARPAGGALRRMAVGALDQGRARREDPAGEDRGPAQRDIVFHSDGLSMAKLGGRWVDRFCDPLRSAADALSLRCLVLSPLHARHRPRARTSRWIQPSVDRANLRGALRARLFPPPCRLPGLDAVTRDLATRGFGTAELAQRRIASDACRLLAVADCYTAVLKSSQPRLAFIVSYYSLEGMAFVLACRRLGIPVIDLQHGVQGEMHPAYAAWPVTSGDSSHALLPDGFWVWTEWEAGVIRAWAQGRAHRPIAGGNPWLDIWGAGSEWPGVAEARQQALGLKAQAAGLPVLLVTLQYGLTAREQLEPLAELLRLSAGEFMCWVRLHPAMLERRSEVLAHLSNTGARYEVELSSDLPLHALLPLANAHLTHSSTTVIEAAQFGLRSVLTSAYGAELFPQVMQAGMATLQTGDAARLAAEIRSVLSAPGTAHPVQGPSRTVETLQRLQAWRGHDKEFG